MTLPFGVGDGLPEPLKQPPEKPLRLVRRGVLGLVGDLAIELVTLGTDRHEVHVHERVYDIAVQGFRGSNP